MTLLRCVNCKKFRDYHDLNDKCVCRFCFDGGKDPLREKLKRMFHWYSESVKAYREDDVKETLRKIYTKLYGEFLENNDFNAHEFTKKVFEEETGWEF